MTVDVPFFQGSMFTALVHGIRLTRRGVFEQYFEDDTANDSRLVRVICVDSQILLRKTTVKKSHFVRRLDRIP